MTTAHDKDVADIREWFATWDKLVDAVDYVSARQLFHPDVVGFGTHMDTLVGLEALENQQWRSVWFSIDGFKFTQESLKVIVSPDRLQATAVITWTSTGYHPDKTGFPRNGRCTLVFTRNSVEEPWRGIHSHLSLNPNTPQKSHGHKPERKAG